MWFAACTLGAFVATKLCMSVFNRVPASWLCDYGEKPDSKLYGTRLFFRPHGIVMVLILTASFFGMYIQYFDRLFCLLAGCFICAILLLIAVSDYKYSIIPDQYTLVLFLTALTFSGYDLLSGQKLFHSGWLSPVLGAGGGAALMLALGLIGRLVFQKEALGFGDVKLFGAVGLFAGFPSVFLIFLLTVFLAFFHIIFLLFRRKITKDLYLPLGPYICLALALFLAFHQEIICFASWYLSLLSI